MHRRLRTITVNQIDICRLTKRMTDDEGLDSLRCVALPLAVTRLHYRR